MSWCQAHLAILLPTLRPSWSKLCLIFQLRNKPAYQLAISPFNRREIHQLWGSVCTMVTVGACRAYQDVAYGELGNGTHESNGHDKTPWKQMHVNVIVSSVTLYPDH